MGDNKPIEMNLRKLVEKSGKTRREIAKELGCDVSTVTKHYNENRNIRSDFIIKYANYFKVSTDYLLGIDDTPTNDKDLAFVCKYTGLNKEAVKKIVEMKKENTKYMNNGEFNANAFVDFNTANFINAFIANNELHYMSLLANDIIFKNYLILSAYSSAIEKISKGKK